MAESLPSFAVLLLALVITLVVFVPFVGVLVRFRANYNPKGLQLDQDGGAVPYTGPVIQSYIAMFKRVVQLEGVSGLYKGLMPTAISTLVVSLIILIFVDTDQPRHGKYRAPETGVFGTLIYSIGMLALSLPSTVLTYRAITTPHNLPYFSLGPALRTLLTPTERRKPWIIYFTPGLMAAEVLHITLVVLFMSPARRYLVPKIPKDGGIDASPFKLIVYFIVLAISVAVLTPLEVIATRLAIQRNHASAQYNSVSQEVEGDATDDMEFSATNEDVIGLRHEGDPYHGLVDCAKRIVEEEGWQTLYRAWWITLIGGLGSSFS